MKSGKIKKTTTTDPLALLLAELDTDPLQELLVEIDSDPLSTLLAEIDADPLEQVVTSFTSQNTLNDLVSEIDTPHEDPIAQLLSDPTFRAVDIPTISSVLTTEPTTTVESIAKVITSTTQTLEQKTAAVIALVASTADTTESQASLLSRAFATVWANSRPIIYTIVWGTMVATAIGLVQIYLGGGSWDFLLGILKYMGTTAVPAIIVSTLKKAGVSIAAGMTVNKLLQLAEKNEKIANVLKRDIKPEIVISALDRMGIDISQYDFSVKNVTQQIVTNTISGGFALYTGNIASYVTSTAFAAGTNAATTAISAAATGVAEVGKAVTTVAVANTKAGITAAIEKLQTVPDLVVDEVLPATLLEETASIYIPEEIDVISVTSDIETKVLNTKTDVKKEKRAETVARKLPSTTEISKSTMDVLIENKSLAVGSLAAAAMIGLAVSGNDHARRALFGIVLNKIGVQSLIDSMVDRLTPEQTEELVTLKSKVAKKGIKPRYIDSFFFTLLGDQIYEESELKGMSIQYLKNAADNKNIKYRPTVTRTSLIAAILDEQTQRLANINQLVTKHLTGILKISIAAATTEALHRGVSTITKEQIQSMIDKLSTQVDPGLKIDETLDTSLPIVELAEQLEQTDIERAEVGIDQTQIESRIEELTSKRYDLPRTDISRPEDAVAARQAEMEAINAELNKQYEETVTARRAAIEEIRRVRREARNDALNKGQSLEEQHRQAEIAQSKVSKANQIKARYEQKLAAKRLQDALRMKDLENAMYIAVSDPATGEVHQIPVNDILMSEEMQKATDWNMLPLIPYLSLLAAKSSTSWIPGVGTFQAAANAANVALDFAETIKKVFNVANVAAQMRGSETLNVIDQKTSDDLDSMLRQRVPSLTQGLESYVRAVGEINVKETLLRVLRDKIVHPEIDVTYELGKRFILGEGLGNHVESTVKQVGEFLLSSFAPK
jgi:hypothetical protein